MRFLVDENIPKVIIRWLQANGHDVVMAAALAAGESDRHWLDLAEIEKRIIITSDKDFGDLVFRDRLNSHGIILLRLFKLSINDRLTRLQETWSVVEANPAGRFIVISPKRIRVRLLT